MRRAPFSSFMHCFALSIISLSSKFISNTTVVEWLKISFTVLDTAIGEWNVCWWNYISMLINPDHIKSYFVYNFFAHLLFKVSFLLKMWIFADIFFKIKFAHKLNKKLKPEKLKRTTIPDLHIRNVNGAEEETWAVLQRWVDGP